MNRIEILRLKGASPHMSGFTLGEAHFALAMRRVERLPHAIDVDSDGAVLALDFNGVESVTASYVKATILQLVRRGAAAARREGEGLNVFPIVANANEEVLGEIAEVMTANDAQILAALRVSDDGIASARLLGELDPVLKKTLEAVAARRSTTATELHQLEGAALQVTAFNNRLSDLLVKRLVRRRRFGRQNTFITLALEVVYG